MPELSCSCQKCIECCWGSPGWFGSIENVEHAASIKDISIEMFVQEYLIREWYYAENIEIPAPRRNFERCQDNTYMDSLGDETERNGKGFVRASWGHNLIHTVPCIFLTNGNRCSIYEGRPYECKVSFGCKDGESKIRYKIEDYWKMHQDWIADMLRKKRKQ